MQFTTPPPVDRRHFLSRLAIGVPAAIFLPNALQQLLAATSDNDLSQRLIESVDIVKVTGPTVALYGIHRQWNSRPSHVYDEDRPAPYRHDPNRDQNVTHSTHSYVRIRAKNGIEGLYGYIDEEAIAPIVNQLGRLLIGKDALAVEKLWDRMFRSNRHSRAGHFMMAISALDCALWDWRGKYYDAPVYELLGGPTRNPVKAYGSALGFSLDPNEIASRCKTLFDQGFDYQKWFFATGPGDGVKGLNTAIDMARILRESIGQNCEIMFDAFMGWDLQFARRWSSAVEQYRPYWIEEPFQVADIESFKRLSKLTNIPIATGEHFYNRFEAQQFLSNDAAQIIQADPEWCGGVSELVKICAIASSYGAKVIPHGHNIHAALHVVASQSPDVCPMAEFLINYKPAKCYFQKNPPLTDNGWITLPTKAGFGIEFDEDKIESTEIISAT